MARVASSVARLPRYWPYGRRRVGRVASWGSLCDRARFLLAVWAAVVHCAGDEHFIFGPTTGGHCFLPEAVRLGPGLAAEILSGLCGLYIVVLD